MSNKLNSVISAKSSRSTNHNPINTNFEKDFVPCPYPNWEKQNTATAITHPLGCATWQVCWWQQHPTVLHALQYPSFSWSIHCALSQHSMSWNSNKVRNRMQLQRDNAKLRTSMQKPKILFSYLLCIIRSSRSLTLCTTNFLNPLGR